MDEVMSLLDAFGAAWNAHDLEAAIALCTDDCVFENTNPPPDGVRAVGHDQLRDAWREIFDNPGSHFDVEETVVAGDRATQLWRYSWGDGHVRGVDIFRIRDGKVAEKFSYVKG